MKQSGVSDPHSIESAVHAALLSMAAVDGPLALDASLAAVEIDSLDLVELTQILEEEFGVTIVAGAFVDAVTVGDVIDVVRSYLA